MIVVMKIKMISVWYGSIQGLNGNSICAVQKLAAILRKQSDWLRICDISDCFLTALIFLSQYIFFKTVIIVINISPVPVQKVYFWVLWDIFKIECSNEIWYFVQYCLVDITTQTK